MNLRNYRKRPILKNEIIEAQKNSRSASEAARFLGVSFITYKKYAVLYGLYQNLINKSGKGIPHPRTNDNLVPLSDIFAGKHPNYNRYKLKRRILAGAILPEECNICGFNEKRVTDQKVPLMLVYRDSNSKNLALENLQLVCYNCAFLTMGELEKINIEPIDSSVYHEDSPLSNADIESAISEAKKELEDV